MKKGLLFLHIFLISCSSFHLNSRIFRKEFVIKRRWVRSTFSKEYYKYRLPHHMKPILFKDLVIQGNAFDGISAFYKKTGNLKWRFQVKGVEQGAVLDKGVLYFGANDGQFYALNALNGYIIWSHPILYEGLGRPVVDEKNVYFITGQDVAYALNKKTGSKVWTYRPQNTLSNLSVRGTAQPLLHEDFIYLGFRDGTLVALNKNNRKVLWIKTLNFNNRFKDIDAQPVYDRGRLFVTGYDSYTYCLNAKTGSVIWKVSLGGVYPLTIDGERLYLSTTDHQIVSLDKNSGKILWTKKTRGLASKPVILRQTLVFGESEGNLVFMDKNEGHMMASFNPGRGVLSEITADGNHIYFISADANLFALKAEWKKEGYKWPWEKIVF
ncbi:MAG: hypothetical protein D6797_01480 [Bdellovibrio sp.]|nr:MAG: hypothetical protein D6797_01480 [Bdellovibrio sp.]